MAALKIPCLILFIPGFLAGLIPGGGRVVFHLHPVTPLSLQSDDSNFVQNYFGVRSIFCDKKNRDQIDNDVTRRHFCSDEYRELLKTAYIKITAASLSFLESY